MLPPLYQLKSNSSQGFAMKVVKMVEHAGSKVLCIISDNNLSAETPFP
jgi:hypothetical protein